MCVGRQRLKVRVAPWVLGMLLTRAAPVSAQAAAQPPAPTSAQPPAPIATGTTTSASPPHTAAVTVAPAVRASRPIASNRELRCTARCIREFEEGSYRVWIDSTDRVAGGSTIVDIHERGAYRVEGAPRSRRAPGLLLTATGIVLSGIGAGMAIGGGAFRTGLTSSEEAWFWAGMVTTGTGVTLIPVGMKLYSRSPRVDGVVLQGGPAFAATSSEPLPRRYGERLLRDGEPVPSGNVTVEEPRWGLLSAGAVTFATSYGIMAAVAAGAVAEGTDGGEYARLFIPIFGPSLFDRRRGEGPVLTIFGTIPELTGALLMLLGATGTRRFPVQSEPSLTVAPLLAPSAGGLSVYGSF